MNRRIDTTIQRLTARLEPAETSLNETKSQLATAVDTGIEALESHWNALVAKLDEKRGEAVSTGDKIWHALAEKKDELVERFETWQVDREIDKLEKHADRLEEDADDAIVAAAVSLLVAQAAVIKALKARKVADEVAG